MLKEELVEISNIISEVITDLKTSLKQEIEKDLNHQLILSKYLGDTEKDMQALTLCHYKAKGCKQIELDFPDTLIAANGKLSLKFETIRVELVKRYAIILGNPPNKGSEERSILTYKTIKLFLHDVFIKFRAGSLVEEKILDFLALCLKTQNSIDIYKFNEELQAFFDFISLLIEKKFIQDSVCICIEGLDALEKKEFFSQKNSEEIQRSFYRLVHEIDGLIVYKSLLAKMNFLAGSVFSDDLFAKEFIKTFINQFSSIFFIKEADFESIFILMYLALESKARTPIIETHSVWINNLGSMVKKLVETEISLGLIKFKDDYEKKIGNKFDITLNKFKRINAEKEAMAFKAEEISPEIVCWFPLENINRSSGKVKNAFSIALEKTDYLAFTLPENAQSTKNNIKNSLEKRVGIFKNLFVDSKDKLANTVFKVYTQLNEHMQVNISPQDALKKLEPDPKILLALNSLQEKLKKVERDLQAFSENIKFFFGSSKIINFSVAIDKKADVKDSLDTIFSLSSYEEKYSRLEIEIETLEKIISEFLEKNYPVLFVKKVLEKIRHIKEESSWFEAKFFNNQVSAIEKVFKRGYFMEKHVKLTKLKTRLDRQISFEFEEAFFLEENFFTLLHYGIIRWFWIDKKTFAKSWAEQVVFLKVADEIKEGSYEQKYEENEKCVADKSFNSESKRFQKLVELYKQMIAAKLEIKYSISNLFSNLNKDIKSFESKIENLLIEIKNCILVFQKKSSLPLDSKMISDREGVSFFNDRTKTEFENINYSLPLRLT